MTIAADPTHMLDDFDVARLIARGYHHVQLDGMDEVHAKITRTLAEKFQQDGQSSGSWSSEAFAEVLGDPRVRGVIRSFFGEAWDRDVNPDWHVHVHGNQPGKESVWTHRDSYASDPRIHQMRHLKCFYYPHDVTAEMGPTIVFPGTHFRNGNPIAMKHYMNIRGQVPLICKAGSFFVTSGNLWHGAAPNRSDRVRYLVKIEYGQSGDRPGITWNHDPTRLQEVMSALYAEPDLPCEWSDQSKRGRLRRKAWDWLCGKDVD